MKSGKMLSITGVIYTVFVQEKLPDEYQHNPTWMGRVNTAKAEIYINSSLSNDVDLMTLIHEYVHAVLDNYAYRKMCADETFVSIMSRELFDSGLFQHFMEDTDND